MKDSIIGLSRNMGAVTDALKNLGTNSDNLGTLLKSTDAAMPMIQSSLAAAGKTNADNQKIAASMQTTVSQSAKDVSANLDYIQNSNREIGSLFRSLNESAAGGNASAVNTVLPVISAQLNATDSSIEATIAYLGKCRDCDYNADIDKVITGLQNTEKSLDTLRQALVDLEQQIGSAHKATDDLYQYVRDHQQDINSAVDAANTAMQAIIPAVRDLAKNPVVPADIQSQLTTLADELDKIYNNGQTGAELKKDLQAFLDSQGKTDAAFNALEKALPQAVSTIDTAKSNIDKTITVLRNVETTNNTVRKAQYDSVIADLQAIRPSLQDEQSQLSVVQSQLLSANTVAKSAADLVNADSARIASQIADAVTTYNARIKPDLQTISQSLVSSLKDASAMISQAQQMSTRHRKYGQNGAGGRGPYVEHFRRPYPKANGVRESHQCARRSAGAGQQRRYCRNDQHHAEQSEADGKLYCRPVRHFAGKNRQHSELRLRHGAALHLPCALGRLPDSEFDSEV